MPRDHFLKEVWQPLYESLWPVTLDQLGFMFMILACGALVGSAMEAENSEADKFYQLGRAAMAVRSSPPSIIGIRMEVREVFAATSPVFNTVYRSSRSTTFSSVVAGKKRGFRWGLR